MIEALQFEFMRNALIAAILASVACGIVGVYVVVKRIAFISGAIAHAAFGGIGLGYLLGVNPMACVIPFSLFSAIGIGLVSRKSKLSEDTTIGIFWAVGMALGIIFIGISGGYVPDLFGYLFGNILTVSPSAIKLMIVLDIIIVLAVGIFYKEFLAVTFDEEYAKISGIRVMVFYLLLLCLVALTVVLLIQMVGIILIIALLTIPPAIVKQYNCNSLIKMMLFSIGLGMIFTITGIWVAYFLNSATGATIILCSGLGFLISTVSRRLFSKKELCETPKKDP